MSFYSSIAPYYDLIFPFDETIFRFLEKVIDPTGGLCPVIRAGEDPVAHHSYLDIGCGTGSMLSAFSDRFNHLVGIDTDPVLLAYAAKKMLPGEGKKVELLEESMTEIERLFPEEEFSFITCLGNTLPHLTKPVQIMQFFTSVRKVLETGGVFVFQTINYDRVLADGVRGLPTIERDDVDFERYYSVPDADGLIDFDTILTDGIKDIELKNSVKIYPLTKKIAEDALKTAGFSRWCFYSDFTGMEWRPDAYLTIGVALA